LPQNKRKQFSQKLQVLRKNPIISQLLIKVLGIFYLDSPSPTPQNVPIRKDIEIENEAFFPTHILKH